MVSEGDRVKLIHTPDKFTKLEPGAKGTVASIDTISEEVSGVEGGQKQVWVVWDEHGGKLALLEDEDEWEVIDDE